MKELSIKERAKAYDGLIERLKDLKFAYRFSPLSDTIEEKFPELKESEDERIRKEMIEILKNEAHDFPSSVIAEKSNSWIAWLEKQGEQKFADGTFVNVDDVREDFVQEVYRVLDADSTNDRANQIIDAFDNLPTFELDKQDEQNLANSTKTCKDEPKFKIGDTIIAKPFTYMEHKPFHITKIEDDYYWDGDDTIFIGNQNNFELVEQKSTDKVELKFKIGDWVVFNNKHQSIYQVEKIEDGHYILRHTHGGTLRVCILHDESLRLWTIQDAKDGDVLVASDGSIFLFKCTIDLACKHYVALTTDDVVKFNEGFEHYWEASTGVHPATKEQREQLEKAITEAGYEWDAERKELKGNKREIPIQEPPLTIKRAREVMGIKQNYAWSEVDEKFFKTALWHISNSVSNGKNTDEHCATTDWLKALKERIQPQPKQK